jgi:hypothetical protein
MPRFSSLDVPPFPRLPSQYYEALSPARREAAVAPPILGVPEVPSALGEHEEFTVACKPQHLAEGE